MSRYSRAPERQRERELHEGELPGRRFVFVAPPVDLRDFVRIAATRLGMGAETQASVNLRVERHGGLPLGALHATTAARGLRAPLLVLHDEGDREVPLARAQELADAWSGARLETTRGLGHHRILWDPAVTKRIAAFLVGD